MAKIRCWRACTSRAGRGRFRHWSSATAAVGAPRTVSLKSSATRPWLHTASCPSHWISALEMRRRILPRCRTVITPYAGQSSMRGYQDQSRPRRPLGQSSGGHLAMLVAMRPHDPRYAAIPLPESSTTDDASVRCVVMSWPVINPFSRYRHAKRLLASANPPEWAKSGVTRQEAYWESESQHGGGQPDADTRTR